MELSVILLGSGSRQNTLKKVWTREDPEWTRRGEVTPQKLARKVDMHIITLLEIV